MEKFRNIYGLLLSMLLVSLLPSAPAPALAQTGELTLVGEGPHGLIVWWSSSSSPVPAFAAEEMQSYVRSMPGTTVPVVEGISNSQASAIPSAVVLLDAAEAKKYLDGDESAKSLMMHGGLSGADAQAVA